VAAWAKTLSAELAPEGITVNNVSCPVSPPPIGSTA
jgi:NAD(P)-dependent dehydrogenase (short-subunit alcohol dehydrogenase family)